jgi:hypothetical protein
MTDMTVKIIVEILSILAIVTTEIKQRRRSELITSDVVLLTEIGLEKYLNKLLGRNDVEDALKRLDKLTQEEAKMAMVEVLRATHRVIDGAQRVPVPTPTFFSTFLCSVGGSTQQTANETASNIEEMKRSPSPNPHYHRLPVLSHPHRKPATTRPSKVAVSPGSLDES